ncbi:hypothetical protein [Streptomyces sp. NPDC005438]|uniref:hypothetical protein n=1 Tax=Streptomyces sp. NPDC005438 TaxID=3156880 RepID=UPI0033ADEF7D
MNPPPFRLSRRRDRAPLEPALDDTALATARNALQQGRWTEVRELLLETGEDWNLRGHRIEVLAQAENSETWALDWRLAEPDSAEAACLIAAARTRQALARGSRPEPAVEAIEEARRLLPQDPTPWLEALRLWHRMGTPEQRARAFDEVRARVPYHHQGHHLWVAELAEHAQGGSQDHLPHPVYEFATQALSRRDSPLAVLPVLAHAERYRVLAAHQPDKTDLTAHWNGWRAQQVTRIAFDRWLDDQPRHPRWMVDLNLLAHAKFHQGRLAEAAALFQRIGPHVSAVPWAFGGRDPVAEFRAARSAALGG